MKPAVRVAWYARVSTQEQAERQSIETQLDFARRYADLHGLTWEAVYTDDGVPGTLALKDRPGGAALLADAAAGRFQSLYVYRLDRIGREPRLILQALHDLQGCGCTVKSATEPFDTGDAAGRLMVTMLAGFSGYEHESITARMMEGHTRKARANAWTGGPRPPYAFQVTEGRLIPYEPEAAVIRDLYARLVAEETTCWRLADHLNAAGTPTPQGEPRNHPRTGRPIRLVWTAAMVNNLLRSPIYRGERLWGKRRKGTAPPISQSVPAIVDRETWDRAQAQLSANRKRPRAGRTPYLLRGLLRCGKCGLFYHGWKPKPEGWYYVCNGKHRDRGPIEGRCTNRNLHGPRTEAALWEKVEAVLRDPGAALEVLARESDPPESSARLRDRTASLLASLAEKAAERDRILSLYRRGRITERDLDRQLDQLDAEEGELRRQAAETERQREDARDWQERLGEAEGLLERLRGALREGIDPERQRAVLVALVALVDVVDGELRVSWRL